MRRKGRLLMVGLMVLALVFVAGALSAKEVENRLAYNEYPVILMDPALTCDFMDAAVFFNLYDGLTYPTPDGSYRPHLAESWTASPDAKTWTFKLRQGVKFHDGKEMTADDVVFSMKRMLAIGQGYSGFYVGLKDVKATGPLEVVFELEKPFATFPATLALLGVLNKDLVMQHAKKEGKYGEMGDYGMEWLANNDAGTGPYKTVEKKTNEYLMVERFKDYWAGWPEWGPDLVPIEKGLFREMWEAATVKTLMVNRDHDITDWYQSDEFYKSLDEVPGIKVVEYRVGSLYTMWINTTKPPTDDVHFRKAICYAFDYDAVAAAVRGGKPIKGVLPSFIKGANPNAFHYTHDLEKAKAELAKSKYKPDQYEVELYGTQGVATFEKMALQLQANLAEIGIKLNVNMVPWSRMAESVAKPDSTANLSVFMFNANYPDLDHNFNFFYNPANTGGVYAAHWMKNEEFGQLLDEARSKLDENERIAVYQKLEEKIMDQALAIYAVETPAVHAIQEYIAGPQETYPTIGPEMNLRNYRINLTEKAKYVK